MGRFVLSSRANGRFQFNLLADNHEVILTSQGYSTRSACEKGIASVRKHALEDRYFERNRSTDSKYYFNLKSSNGKVIGTSEMYESTFGMETGIESVKRNAPLALHQEASVL